MMRPSLILASASPRRIDLLRGAGIDVEVMPSGVEEVGPDDPREHACMVARHKGLAVAQRIGDDPRAVLSADTIVVLDGHILGKPRDAGHAIEMLSQLAGRTHTVLTGYTVSRAPGDVLAEDVIATQVTFRALEPRAIAAYVRTGEPMDKAGAYAAQGVGACIVSRIEGSYTNVVGLPLCEVVETLERLGVARVFAEVAS
jgi:septum formation protein